MKLVPAGSGPLQKTVSSFLSHKTSSPINSSTYMRLVPAGSGPLQKTVSFCLSHKTSSPIISSTSLLLLLRLPDVAP